MRVLAIDVGTRNVGFAHGGPDGPGRAWGTYHPPATGKDIAWLLADVRAWMTTLLSAAEITNVVYCAPILIDNNNWWTIRKVVSLAGQIELGAYDAGLQVEEVDEPKVRKHFLAPYPVPRTSDAIKAAVIARCRQLRWDVDTDHEADAMAVLDYALALKGSRTAGLLV